jgi:hypothetical protein
MKSERPMKFRFICLSGFTGEDFLEIGQSETIVNCLWGFQRRRLKCEKLTDDGSQVMAKAHFAYSKVS